jgi:hypothetical protein
MDYALRFYSWVDEGAAQQGNAVCSASAENPECATFRAQVLSRLIEERLVTQYAAAHKISLTRSDLAKVEEELARLQAPHSGTDRLFVAERVSPRIIRSVLETQLLVRRVEATLVSPQALRGPMLQVRKFVFGLSKHNYRQAVDLATSGTSATTLSATRPLWVALFRLSPQIRRLTTYAAHGAYVGPFRQGTTYVVLQVLGRSTRRYGRPARELIMARAFRSWMKTQLLEAHPTCLTAGRASAPCRVPYH